MPVAGPIAWPNGARIAVALTFDVDAESIWLCREIAEVALEQLTAR